MRARAALLRTSHRYVRMPLVVAAFTRDGMTSALMDPQLQALLEAVLFEPLAHASGARGACYHAAVITPSCHADQYRACVAGDGPDGSVQLDIVPIPADDRSILGTGSGVLMRELLVCPGAIVPPLQHLADQVSALCTPERYKDGFVPLLLFLLRQLVRLQVRCEHQHARGAMFHVVLFVFRAGLCCGCD